MGSANAYTQLTDLVMSQTKTLEERLACILKDDGSHTKLPDSIRIDDVHGYNGMSGYNYWVKDELIAQLYLGTLVSGTYVVYKKTFINNYLNEEYDYYDQEGNFFYKSSSLDGQCLYYTSIAMDPTSPFINHIYNILHVEYQGATVNYGNTGRIKFYEELLKVFYNEQKIHLSANDGIKDSALKNINIEIFKVERDAVLKWTERQIIFDQLKQLRNQVLATKRRAHAFQFMLYDFVVMVLNLKVKFQLFKARPVNNFFGSMYKYTLGNLFWFANTVKSNLGYSVALAIYGPFTFYFITQPMNPHAMWAVGKVRNSYIAITKVMEGKELPQSEMAKNEESINMVDKVSTKQSSANAPMPLGKRVSWDERMSNFKAMQISYEEDMVFSERMGRIEQFETQFNFPLTAEAAWMEMELYLEDIEGKIKFNNNLDARFLAFLNNEKERTLELQFYIWQKVGQFFIDHPYIVVDEEGEQTERNYYVGRQFVFFKRMAEKLSQIGIANSPKTHQNVELLGKKFAKMRIEGSSVLDTLKKNSKLFRQKDFLSSDEHRKYMKRQWEVLFMQQNKKQEASSFALQAYTWSVRNAIWLMQTIYSAKRSEIGAMTYRYNLDNVGAESTTAKSSMNQYMENMFHNLTMEYVSIKKELVNDLKYDNEAKLRENVINNIKQYLIERDKLFNSGVYAQAEQQKGSTI